MTDQEKIEEIIRLLYEAYDYDHYMTFGDGHHKSSDGCVFHSLGEALETVREWHRDEMSCVYDADGFVVERR